MLYTIVLFIGLLCCIDAAHPRIVNGESAEEGEFPFAVSVRDRYYSHFCGGTILDENHILTAAHCFCDELNREPPYSIQYGSIIISADANRSVPVANFSCNSGYVRNKTIYDVAVLRLESSLPKGNWAPVKLATEFSPILFGKGTIIGWGMLWDDGPSSKVLQKLEVNILSDIICAVKFDITHHICISVLFSGACMGDSGSALLVNGVQVGIASFITNNCEGTSIFTPNVYARVPNYMKWIETLMLN